MDFAAHVTAQHEAVARFITLLEQEQALLVASPIDSRQLSGLSEQKSACTAELETLEQARQAILTNQGYSPDRQGAERLAAALGCTPLWQAFIARVRNARLLNDVNGQAIRERLDHSQQAMTLLERAFGGGLYGPDGQTSSAGDKHLHGSV